MRKSAKSNHRSPTAIDAHVGARLRILRRGHGVSQSDLGAWLGVSYAQVQKYECGVDRVSAARLFQLARIFKVPMESFFEGL
ncbi:MAG TPA: helix-turn-helix transcriptional regulator [Rhizomicrobium sp.]|nr:helix-turn-helix transcriptional regulator [Rhizomicrobium sp.]